MVIGQGHEGRDLVDFFVLEQGLVRGLALDDQNVIQETGRCLRSRRILLHHHHPLVPFFQTTRQGKPDGRGPCHHDAPGTFGWSAHQGKDIGQFVASDGKVDEVPRQNLFRPAWHDPLAPALNRYGQGRGRSKEQFHVGNAKSGEIRGRVDPEARNEDAAFDELHHVHRARHLEERRDAFDRSRIGVDADSVDRPVFAGSREALFIARIVYTNDDTGRIENMARQESHDDVRRIALRRSHHEAGILDSRVAQDWRRRPVALDDLDIEGFAHFAYASGILVDQRDVVSVP